MNDTDTPTLAEALRLLYTGGWCGLLAFAFKHIDPARFTVVQTTAEHPYHLAVVDRDGRLWDIDGPASPDVWAAKWGGWEPLGRQDVDPQRAGIACTRDAWCGPANDQAWNITVQVAREMVARR